MILVDQCDEQLLADYAWLLNYKKQVMRYLRLNGQYVGVELLARRIMGAPADKVVDHINGNPLDNRRSNLRICTHAENSRNRKRASNNSTGYKGVHFDRDYGLYRARLRYDGKTINIGRFATAKEAHDAYKVAALKYHGEFANFG